VRTVAIHLSVIVPAFEEEQSLGAVVEEVVSILEALGNIYELIVVDDGSRDATGAIAEQLAKGNPTVRVIHHPVNKGLGEVYRTGFALARGEFITFIPADGEIPAANLKSFMPLMGQADLVLGSFPNRGISFLSKAERILFWLLFGPLPKFQGIFMFRRTLLNEIELKSSGRGWMVMMELIIRASRSGFTIASVPTEMRPRMSGKSKVRNLPNIWVNLKQVIALRLYLSRNGTREMRML
jgi:glycosyltransferase involved in cell wall biosynthesis